MNKDLIKEFVGLAGPYYFGGENTFILEYLMKDLFITREDKALGEPYRKLEKGQKIPMLLLHSRHDGLIGFESAEMFCQKALEKEIPAKLHTVKEKWDNHSSYSAGIFLEKKEDSDTLDRLLKWIAGCWEK